jgi:hypothetical protein
MFAEMMAQIIVRQEEFMQEMGNHMSRLEEK